MRPLSNEQLDQYAAQGYLLVSGLIPAAVAAAAEAAMWRALGLSPEERGAWSGAGGGHRVYEDPELVALYTAELCAAAAQLAGDGEEPLPAPRQAYAINVFPREVEWRWPA